MSTARKALLAVTALALVAACGEATGTDGPRSGAGLGDLRDRTFVSTSILDAADPPLRAGTTVRLTFGADVVSGSAECNSLSSGASLAQGHLVVDGRMGGTEMGCGDRQFHDTWLADFLTSRPTVVLDGDRLTLASAGTVVQLEDERSLEPDRPLVGTPWELEAIEDGTGPDATAASVPAGVTSTLWFDADGWMGASPGCNGGEAAYRVTGDAIALEPMALTRKGCRGPAREVESTVVDLLRGTVTYVVDGPRLRLTRGARTLVYRAG